MNAKNNRYCVILCGGTGSRLWPQSRIAKPKQFIDFLGTGKSLLQITVERLRGIVPAENFLMVTNEQYAGLVKEQIPDISDDQILLEPARRSTAPCITWAAYHIRAIDPDAKIMVAPSDHLVLNGDEYRASVLRAFDYIDRHDVLLALAVKPHRAETRYGYIQAGKADDERFFKVKTFTEKPPMELAKVFVDSGEFYWNSGTFFWSANAIINAISEFAPKVSAVFESGASQFGTAGEREFITEIYPSCLNVPLDIAVLDKADNVFMQAVDFGWTDIGTWGALYDTSPKNRDGNVTQRTKALLIDSSNNLISAPADKLVVASNLNDFVVVDSDDVLLIAPRSEEQKIRGYVHEVKAKFGDKYL